MDVSPRVVALTRARVGRPRHRAAGRPRASAGLRGGRDVRPGARAAGAPLRGGLAVDERGVPARAAAGRAPGVLTHHPLMDWTAFDGRTIRVGYWRRVERRRGDVLPAAAVRDDRGAGGCEIRDRADGGAAPEGALTPRGSGGLCEVFRRTRGSSPCAFAATAPREGFAPGGARPERAVSRGARRRWARLYRALRRAKPDPRRP
jgi:hypothetical protein